MCDDHRPDEDFTPDDDIIRAILSKGCVITDPDQAEALGLTADAKRMREARGD